jgi:STE24 endopeptidase
VKNSMLTLTTVLVALALSLVVWRLTPWGSLPVDLSVKPAEDDFTATEIESAHAFRSTLRTLSLLSLASGLLFIALLGFSSLGPKLIERLPGAGFLQTMLAVVVLSLTITLVRIPFAVAGERIARREGLSTNTWSSWLQDLLKSTVLSMVIAALALGLLGLVARWQPRTWWLYAAGGAAALTLALSFIFPLVVEPLFNRFTPMPPSQLRSELLDLAQRDGVAVTEVLVADASRRTTALNAYVSGFGPTRRIVVYDNLLKQAPEAEVRMVVAHELGHAKERDVLVGSGIAAIAAALGVLLLALLLGSRIGRPESVATVMAVIALLSFLQQPAAGLISRQVEARADLHALELTRDPQVLAEMQRRLATTNRADVIAPRWAYLLFATHPSTRERIALARWWAEREGLPVPQPLARR